MRLDERKTKKCVAIKDGYMESRRQFAKKGDIYYYYENWNNKFMVDTYKDFSYNHSMSQNFFFTYFMPVSDFFYGIKLTDEDLLI